MTETSNVVSIAEWKANQHRKRLAGLKWTWYEVVRDPNGRIELVPIEPKAGDDAFVAAGSRFDEFCPTPPRSTFLLRIAPQP